MDAAHVDHLFHAIDAMDPDAFVGFITPSGSFKFGNAPPVQGRDAIRTLVAQFWGSIRGSRHRRLHVWRDGDAVAVHGEVTYTRLDEREVTVPFVNVFKMQGDQIDAYLIHIDNTPLFAA